MNNNKIKRKILNFQNGHNTKDNNNLNKKVFIKFSDSENDFKNFKM